MFVEQKQEENDKDFLQTTINKGHKLKLDFEVDHIIERHQQILSWEFRTYDYDIKFGILSEDKSTGERRSEVSLGTVYSNEMDEIGFIFVRPNTKCKLLKHFSLVQKVMLNLMLLQIP